MTGDSTISDNTYIWMIRLRSYNSNGRRFMEKFGHKLQYNYHPVANVVCRTTRSLQKKDKDSDKIVQ